MPILRLTKIKNKVNVITRRQQAKQCDVEGEDRRQENQETHSIDLQIQGEFNWR